MAEIPNKMSAKDYMHYIKTGQIITDKKGRLKQGALSPEFKKLLDKDKELSENKSDLIFIIYHKLITLNEYINSERKNKYEAANIKKKMTTICSNASNSLIGISDPNSLYDLHIIWNVTNNRQDADNIYYSVKFIIDGMVKSGIINNDGRKNIRHIYNEIYTKKEYKIIVKLIKVNLT